MIIFVVDSFIYLHLWMREKFKMDEHETSTSSSTSTSSPSDSENGMLSAIVPDNCAVDDHEQHSSESHQQQQQSLLVSIDTSPAQCHHQQQQHYRHPSFSKSHRGFHLVRLRLRKMWLMVRSSLHDLFLWCILFNLFASILYLSSTLVGMQTRWDGMAASMGNMETIRTIAKEMDQSSSITVSAVSVGVERSPTVAAAAAGVAATNTGVAALAASIVHESDLFLRQLGTHPPNATEVTTPLVESPPSSPSPSPSPSASSSIPHSDSLNHAASLLHADPSYTSWEALRSRLSGFQAQRILEWSGDIAYFICAILVEIAHWKRTTATATTNASDQNGNDQHNRNHRQQRQRQRQPMKQVNRSSQLPDNGKLETCDVSRASTTSIDTADELRDDGDYGDGADPINYSSFDDDDEDEDEDDVESDSDTDIDPSESILLRHTSTKNGEDGHHHHSIELAQLGSPSSFSRSSSSSSSSSKRVAPSIVAFGCV